MGGRALHGRLIAVVIALVGMNLLPMSSANGVSLTFGGYKAIQWTSSVQQFCRPVNGGGCATPMNLPYWAWTGVKGEIKTPPSIPSTDDDEREWGVIAMAFSMANDSNIALGWYITDTQNQYQTQFDNILIIQTAPGIFAGYGDLGHQSPSAVGQFKIVNLSADCWYSYINDTLQGYTPSGGSCCQYAYCGFLPPGVAVAGAVIAADETHADVGVPPLGDAFFGNANQTYGLQIRRSATGNWEPWDSNLTVGETSRYDTAYGTPGGCYFVPGFGWVPDGRYYHTAPNAFYRIKAYGGPYC